MIGGKKDGRAVAAGRMYDVYQKFLSMEINPALQTKYCNFLYRMYQKNIKNICLATGYTYIPNNRLSLRDTKKFHLNTLDIVNTTAEHRNGYNIYEIDRELAEGVSCSLSENLVLFQPIWAEYSPKNNTYFIFDGSHRFLALLSRVNASLPIPETLLITLNKEKLERTTLEIFVPDCVYDAFDIFAGRNNMDTIEQSTILYSFTYCGTKMYAMNVSYNMLKKVIVPWTMIIDLMYSYHVENKIKLTPAEMVHKNIFKGQTTHELLY